MTSNFYDVVVIGMDLAPLVTGALLAKRGFRVLLLGDTTVPPTYTAAGKSLPRHPFTFHSHRSPASRRVLSELALVQRVRRRARDGGTSLQLVFPQHRFDLGEEPEGRDRELGREFPEVRRSIEEFHRRAANLRTDFDALLERDLAWPPETFLERREFTRAITHRTFDRQGRIQDPFRELPASHPFRVVATATALIASEVAPEQLTHLETMLLYASFLANPVALGADELRALLVDTITTGGGSVLPHERAERIEMKRNAVVGVRIAKSDETVGCGHLVAGCELARLRKLLPDRAVFESIFERFGEPQPRFARYTLNLVVRDEGVPVGMARDVLFIPEPRKPLTAENCLHIEVDDADSDGLRRLCIEARLPLRDIEERASYLETARERIIGRLEPLLPFLDRHLVLVDSPHDGRHGRDVPRNVPIAPDEPWQRGPATMPMVYTYPTFGALGVCALPVRTPVRHLLLCSPQIVPGLGQEGAFVTALTTTRIVSRSDRSKERMRRGLWTKAEI